MDLQSPRGASGRALAGRSVSLAALLFGLSGGLLAQTPEQSEAGFDPRTDQKTAPPAQRVHLSEADLIEPMSPSDYVTRPWSNEPSFGPRPTKEPTRPTFATGVDIDEVLTEPLHAPDGEGGFWVRTRNLRTHFEADAVTAYPAFGTRSPREWPARFELTAATQGGEPLALGPGSAPSMARDGRRVEVARGALTEAWNLDVERIEQTFVFDELPGAGAVEVRIALTTDLVATDERGGDLVLRHEGFGELRYGAAFAVDGAGRRLPLERGFDGETITLTVPAVFVSEATMPLTIDPELALFSNSFGADDDLNVDICYAGNPGRYFFVWEDFTSAANSDVYISSFDAAGNQGAVVLLDGTSEYWGTPSIGYVAGHDRILVASSVSINGPGVFPSMIRGHIFDPVAETVVGTDFGISTSGTEKLEPVVGGTNADLTFNNHFLVAWSRILAPDRWSIEYRVVDFDGSGVTPVTVVDNTVDRRNHEPEVSASHGDATLTGDYWTLVWTETPGSSVFNFGRIKARRIVWSGSTQFGSGNFTVSNNLLGSHPSVTSRLDRTYANATDRPSIVAYSRRDLGNGLNGDIFAHVITDGVTNPENPITAMEDVWVYAEFNQFDPVIATDGRAFVLAYTEAVDRIDHLDLDVSVCSGTIAEDGNDARLGLAERHDWLLVQGFGETADRSPSIAMVQDGDNTSFADDAMIAFRVQQGVTNPDQGTLFFSSFDAATSNFLTGRNAVGRQYCDSNRHYGSALIGSYHSSWIWIEGNQVAGATHWARCLEMPTNVFSLLICSRQTGDFNLAGGAGRLCLSGSIGRFNAQITNSGSTGTAVFPVDTSALPVGSAPVAVQPGETWHFQVWHRDTTSTGITSNYSNAASVTFNP